MASPWRTCARRSRRSTWTRPRETSTASSRPTRSAPTISCSAATVPATIDRRLSQRRPGASVGRRQRGRRSGERQAGGLDERRSRRSSSIFSGSRARTSSTVVDRIKALLPAAASSPPAVGEGRGADRPHHDDSRFRRRRRIRVDADRRTGRDGHFPVPAQPLGHHHPQRRRAALARSALSA